MNFGCVTEEKLLHLAPDCVCHSSNTGYTTCSQLVHERKGIPATTFSVVERDTEDHRTKKRRTRTKMRIQKQPSRIHTESVGKVRIALNNSMQEDGRNRLEEQ